MRVFIISDTHGYDGSLLTIEQAYGRPDVLIHAGDMDSSDEFYKRHFRCVTHLVAGNNDFSYSLPSEDVFPLLHHTCFLTHGHRHRVHYGTDDLERIARSNRADILIYGHTHMPVILQKEGLLILNPGSLSYPRQSDHRPTFIILNIDDRTEELDPELVKL